MDHIICSMWGPVYAKKILLNLSFIEFMILLSNYLFIWTF